MPEERGLIDHSPEPPQTPNTPLSQHRGFFSMAGSEHVAFLRVCVLVVQLCLTL